MLKQKFDFCPKMYTLTSLRKKQVTRTDTSNNQFLILFFFIFSAAGGGCSLIKATKEFHALEKLPQFISSSQVGFAHHYFNFQTQNTHKRSSTLQYLKQAKIFAENFGRFQVKIGRQKNAAKSVA